MELVDDTGDLRVFIAPSVRVGPGFLSVVSWSLPAFHILISLLFIFYKFHYSQHSLHIYIQLRICIYISAEKQTQDTNRNTEFCQNMAVKIRVLKAVVGLIALCLAGYIVGPPLYWHLLEGLAAVSRSSSASTCPACICDCDSQPHLTIPQGMNTHTAYIHSYMHLDLLWSLMVKWYFTYLTIWEYVISR